MITDRTLSYVGVATAIGLGVLAGAVSARRPLAAAIGALGLLLLLPLGAALRRSRQIDPLEPLWPFLICYGITYVFKPMLDARGGYTYDWFTFDATLATRAVVVATAGLAAIYVGYLSGIYRVLLPILPSTRQEPTAARARVAALGLAAGGVLALFLMRAAISEFSLGGAVSGAFRTRILQAAYGRGYIVVLASLAAFAPPLQIAIALTTRRRLDWALATGITGIVGVLLVALYSRQLMLQMIVMLVVVGYFKGRWLTRGGVVVAGVAILIVGGFLGLRLRAADVGPLQAFAFLGHTFDSFEFLASALARVSPLGHFSGVSFVEDAVLTYLPRLWFPEKPDVYGIVRIQNYVQPSFSAWSVSKATFPPGFLVEGYANFGVAGIALISLCYGVLLRLAREWFWPRRDRLFPMLVYGGLVLNMTGVFRSAAQTAMQMLVFGSIIYALLYARIPVRSTTPERLAA
jgi:hypothetical protein